MAESRYFGLRLALWYGALFLAGSTLIVLLTYWVTSLSLAQRDEQIIQSKLGEYAVVYANGGLTALSNTVRAEQLTAPERLFVRVIDRGAEALVLAAGWLRVNWWQALLWQGLGRLVRYWVVALGALA